MINELKRRNDEILKTNLDKQEVIKHTAISNILNDQFCFFKMNINDAFNILFDLKYNEVEASHIYKDLISSKQYVKMIEEMN